MLFKQEKKIKIERGKKIYFFMILKIERKVLKEKPFAYGGLKLKN
tara:strand:- start:496 stop:630 length:135 start_codon:yes stop_codon:yes gene_type:complete